ncbi:hypothetical protein POTOM_021000 [Populus tomentosa]|uniref:Endopeptidase Clp n=1 Tax=Populus tomentosa TaxID=118781 RepID=A0A8X7ZR55_POPTO|nr:hypothetical protein POTOM_021000 [Populus tomentosa]
MKALFSTTKLITSTTKPKPSFLLTPKTSTTRAYSLIPMRIVCINGPINDDTSNVVVAQLLFLEYENPSKPIHMYLNSPGGHVTAGLAIYDTMQYIRSPVNTICLGQAASMASLLLASGLRIVRVWDALNQLYCKHTGKPIDVIHKNMDRDYFMTPEEAKEFGIIDEVIDQRPMTLVTDAVGNESKQKGSS